MVTKVKAKLKKKIFLKKKWLGKIKKKKFFLKKKMAGQN
jgi:hypothetical protein